MGVLGKGGFREAERLSRAVPAVGVREVRIQIAHWDMKLQEN